MNIREILTNATAMGASDIFLVGGLPLTYKIDGKQNRIEPDRRLMPGDINSLMEELYTLVGRTIHRDASPAAEDDFSFALTGSGRFRANVFCQRGSMAAVIRVIRFGVPDPVEAHIPESVMRLADSSKGLVLVTGAAGNGKTLTLSCLIDAINSKYQRTIITMEDPIEVVHHHKQSIVIQREMATDTANYITALRAALREAPDVLLVGEVRDAETMEVTMTAAETGLLVFTTMHTVSAPDTIDRIIDLFPANKQRQILAQLSRTLRSVVCQQLVPGVDGTLYPAFEIMHVTPAIRNLIREGKTYQFPSVIQEGGKLGMCSMNSSLAELVKSGTVDLKTAMAYSEDPAQLEKRVNARL